MYRIPPSPGLKDRSNAGGPFKFIICALSIAVCLSAAAAHAQTIANGTYTITNKASGLVLDDYNNSTTAGTYIDQWPSSGGNNQKWTLTNLGNNYVELINGTSGYALDVYQASTANNGAIDQWPYSSGRNQIWQVVSKGGGEYELVNENSGLALDDPQSSTTEGTYMIQYTPSGNSNQLWSFSSTSGGGGGTTLSGSLNSHDPSRMTLSNGNYYVYSTGPGIPMLYSPDRIHWSSGPSVFPNGLPSWTRSAVPGSDGRSVWAPDVLYFNGLYHLYYAVPYTNKYAAIGLATNPTLDPNASNYHWTDQGEVIGSTPSSPYMTIDPAPVFDASGNLWLSFGSGYVFSASSPQILLVQLNSSTGLRESSNSTIHDLADGHIEASYIFYRNGYYYLFYNSGGCCSGTSSTYQIHISRSTSIFGPYQDENGNNGSSIFLSSHSGVYGPGQMGILLVNGTYYFTYHYYNSSSTAVLGEGYLTFNSAGWPQPNNL